jgi:hypothetical protein
MQRLASGTNFCTLKIPIVAPEKDESPTLLQIYALS